MSKVKHLKPAALKLREIGASLEEIARELKISKSTASLWMRNSGYANIERVLPKNYCVNCNKVVCHESTLLCKNCKPVKYFQGSGPFHGVRIWGPVLHKATQRRYIYYKFNNEPAVRMTYARYLMCMYKNRMLNSQEHVDHIDENQLNDVIDNLQILTPSEHSRKTIRSQLQKRGS